MFMNPCDEHDLMLTRRSFFGQLGLGTAALASLLNENSFGQDNPQSVIRDPQSLLPHFAPKAKRVIYLFQAGGPSQLDLFDYKPGLEKLRAQNLPDSVRGGQRLTGMSAYQTSFPTAPSIYKFAQHGQSGAWFSELLPHMSKIADDVTFIKSMHTEQINHDPAVTFALTGFQLAGRPSMGSWVSYGLGSENKDLPAFIAMISLGRNGGDQPLYDRLWGSGFLPSQYQGVKFHNGADPVLYLSNPPGISKESRRQFLDNLSELNQLNAKEYGDPEITARIAQYEMAYRMQSSVPELTDLSKEPDRTFERYGPDAHVGARHDARRGPPCSTPHALRAHVEWGWRRSGIGGYPHPLWNFSRDESCCRGAL